MAKVDIYRMKGHLENLGTMNNTTWNKKDERALMKRMQESNLAGLFSPDSDDRIHVPMYSKPGKGLNFSGGHQTWDWQEQL